MDQSTNSGVYLLLLRLEQRKVVRIGALETAALEPGWYVYAGSARRNLRQRVTRHMTKGKICRWHIDYLTNLSATRSLGALLWIGDAKTECDLNQQVCALPKVIAPVVGFGASDCRNGCRAHLWFSPRELSLSHVGRVIPGGVEFSGV